VSRYLHQHCTKLPTTGKLTEWLKPTLPEPLNSKHQEAVLRLFVSSHNKRRHVHPIRNSLDAADKTSVFGQQSLLKDPRPREPRLLEELDKLLQFIRGSRQPDEFSADISCASRNQQVSIPELLVRQAFLRFRLNPTPPRWRPSPPGGKSHPSAQSAWLLGLILLVDTDLVDPDPLGLVQILTNPKSLENAEQLGCYGQKHSLRLHQILSVKPPFPQQ